MPACTLTKNRPRYCHKACANLSTVKALVSALFSKHAFTSNWRRLTMLHYAVVFLIIALIAAIFGFGGIASGAVGIAKILFFVFVVMAVITFVMSLLKKKG
jgi:uncharacterized membrane protein YtjA (UPF0391 family)